MISYIFRIRNKILSYTVKFKTYIYGLEFKKFGKNNRIWFPVAVYGKRDVSIGDNCGINTYVHIWGNGGVTIGNNVMIATHVSITSLTHDYNAPSMRFSPVLEMPVVIEDDVWIGSNAVIMPGITVGKGAVVGAGAIVTVNVPPNSIVAGAPAKIVKWRNCATDDDKKGHKMAVKESDKVNVKI